MFFEIVEYVEGDRQAKVKFEYEGIVHERTVNVQFDEDGNYDKDATELLLEELSNGVKRKIQLGVISG